MNWTVVLVALAGLPTLAAAQPAAPELPSLSTPDGLQAHLQEIIRLQREQLKASQRASVPALDDTRACYLDGKAYSEGAVWVSPKGQALRCQREAINGYAAGGTAAAPLSWVQQR